MTLKLIPNIEVKLPLKAYYGITFCSLYVGETGITSCVLKVGNNDFEFKACDSDDKTMLRVNGDPGETPTYRLTSDNEKIVLGLPYGAPADLGNEEIVLHHYLSYSVPRVGYY